MEKSLIKWILVLCLALMVGCNKQPQPTCKQTLRLNIPTDPSSLDPRKGGDLVSAIFNFLLFEGLVRLGDDEQIHNALAEKVDVSDDNTVYTFHLKPSIWSNGTPVTAWDFEKAWKDILLPEFPSMNAYMLYSIKNAEKAKLGQVSISEVGIRTIDAKTLEVVLEQPTPYFLELVSFCTFFPVNTEFDHTHPEWDTHAVKHMVCNGPFNIKEWKHNNYIILVKNPYYYNAKEILLEEIHFYMVDSETTAMQMFEKKEIDILGQPLMSLSTDAIETLKEQKKLKLFPAPATTFCTFNVDAFPFNNVNIRKAFSYAINRGEIIHNVTQLQEHIALGIIPPILKKSGRTDFFNDDDKKAAKEHFEKGLKELGITREEFPKLNFLYMISDSQHKIAQALQHQWRDVLGVHVVLEGVERKIQIQMLAARNYQFSQSFWKSQYKDPMSIFERFKSKKNVKNYPNWENEKFNELIRLSSEVKSDKERHQLLQEAEEIFMEEMPLTPIFHWNQAYIAQPNIRTYGAGCIGNGFYDRVYLDTSVH